MAIPKNFPSDPFVVAEPDCRWYPGAEQLGNMPIGALIPPLVAKIRREVKEWRDSGYVGASDTSQALLWWWFQEPHHAENGGEFRYYFSQQEAMESIIYLYEVKAVKDKHDLGRFDSSGQFIPANLPENWRRFVVKMATGSGKTKVIALVIAWSFFHKCYEKNSQLSRNILLVAPNIIVLDRLVRDFDGLRIFYDDPVLPENGFAGQNWRDDFQMRLHRQDEVRALNAASGNIFLTNIHRVFVSDSAEPSADDEDLSDYFLGVRPVGKTTDSKVDLGEVVREIDELLIINDEAHHIHDEKMAWFKSIEDIHNRLLQKDKYLSLQADFSATPKHNNGAIFAQTISDYPLVEAIHQNVVKRPVVPDNASAAKLEEKQTVKYTDRYADYIDLGVTEWRKTREEFDKAGKKAILFVMTDDTKNCDEVAKYLENKFHDLQGKVLVIHTKNNGELYESSSGRKEKELQELRKLANEIDDPDNKYRAVVSVLMLREGWDVRNVTTIVGLRAFVANSKILPEQTLGRGLRRIFPGEDAFEKVSVIGTRAFDDFVKEIEKEGVILERVAMGQTTNAQSPLIVCIDKENDAKEIAALDIAVPMLAPRFARDYSCLHTLNPAKFDFLPVSYRRYSDKEKKREIVFRDVLSNKISHKTNLSGNAIDDYSHVIGYFANAVMKNNFLFSGYDMIYDRVLVFVRDYLFGKKVDLEEADTLRNLAETPVSKKIMEFFAKEINFLLLQDLGLPQSCEVLKVSAMRAFAAKEQSYLAPKKIRAKPHCLRRQ